MGNTRLVELIQTKVSGGCRGRECVRLSMRDTVRKDEIRGKMH